MDKARKKNMKGILALISLVAVAALLAAMPLIARQEPEKEGPQASILSGKVSAGSINTELIGGGTLAEEDAMSISIPSAVKLKAFLVSNGDAVAEGDAIASVDRVTVMTAISQVQETLEYLSEQIEDASEISDEEAEFLFGLEPEASAAYILEHFNVKLVLVTCGANGVFFSNRKASGHIPSLSGIKVVDTTGAGDIFGGSTLWQLLRSGKDPEDLTEEELRKITKFSCTAAGLSTTKQGGANSVPNLEEVLALL